MFLRWAKTVLRLVPLHSMFSAATWTEKDMSVSLCIDVEPLEEADEVRVGAPVEDLEAGVGREGRPSHVQVDRLRVSAEFVPRPRRRRRYASAREARRYQCQRSLRLRRRFATDAPFESA